MSEAVEQLQAQFAELKDRVEQLEACYKDVAYEYLNNLTERIETIRQEVNDAVGRVEEHVYSEAFKKVAEAVEEARQSLRHDAIAKDVKQHIQDAIIDRSTGRLLIHK